MNADTGIYSLAGSWRFATDPEDKGIMEQWFDRTLTAEQINLPGSMTENGKGNDVSLETSWTGRIRDTSFFTENRYETYREAGKLKLPFWLTPLKHYIGAAWYQRAIIVPEEWAGKQVILILERPHWTTEVWINGLAIGLQVSLSTPHRHLLGALDPGTHQVTILVDNRMYVDVGEDAHSISDHSQTNWNGIVGEISLRVAENLRIDDVQVYPAADNKSVGATILLAGVAMNVIPIRAQISVRDLASGKVVSEVAEIEVSCYQETASVRADIALVASITDWDEFQPALYAMEVKLFSENELLDQKNITFGFRQFKARGGGFFLNGKPVFLRGTLECCVFPLTGYPSTDKPSWTRILRILKTHGLNHMRFHSWCPPEAAFAAADEEGVIFSVECASWATVGFDEKYEQWLYQEADHILREYGNHPSFCMMLYGNEPYGFRAATFLAEFVNHYKQRDSRRLFSSGTAWPLIPENQFQVWANPRIQYWDQNLESRINASPPETMTDYSDYLSQYSAPVISHEVGQWCVYPNFDEISKYTGTLKPGNLEIFRDFLEESGMSDQARDFLMASGKLQSLCYKEEIESALRTPGMGGFQLLGLHDFPGQGTAIVGVLDPFWDEKGYIAPEEYRSFAGPVVPLARLEKRIFTNGEAFSADLLVAQFGADDVPAGELTWKLSENEITIYSGTLEIGFLPTGALRRLGEIRQILKDESAARRLTFEVNLPVGGPSNSWDIWVYPPNIEIDSSNEVHIASALNESCRAQLQAGRKVLLMPDNDCILGDERGQVPPGFSSIFWNTAWTQGQKPHTLGILCDPSHPALAHFPTDYHSDWQWWYIIQRSRSMIMNLLPREIKPIVQVIDDWFTARRLGLIFECEIDGGKLLVSSIDLKDGATCDPVCRQMLHSLLAYMKSESFQPTVSITADQISQIIRS